MNDAGAEAVAALVALLDVEPIGADRYRGTRYPGGRGRVFGGQVIAQALVAAARSSPTERHPHSLHAYFMRPGSEDLPIDYSVSRDFDGGSFSTRRVVATQNDVPILTLMASFQRTEQGLEHGVPFPAAQAPSELSGPDMAGTAPVLRRFLARFAAFELRPIPPFGDAAEAHAAPSRLWLRIRSPAPDDPLIRLAMLAYLSDFGLLTTTVLRHGVAPFGDGLQVASLDHALWLHSVPPIDGWLLYTMASPWAGSGRGLAQGTIHHEDGAHIASVAQEGLIRRIEARARKADP